MATVLFYEKPGCRNNTRQKLWLAASGHTVLAKNLLQANWSRRELRPFFGDLPVALWFNPAAPRIKLGEIKPAELDADTALTLMLSDPLLIRRPLLKVNDEPRAGFDADEIRAWIGLNEEKSGNDLEICHSPVHHCPVAEPADPHAIDAASSITPPERIIKNHIQPQSLTRELQHA